MDLSEFLLVAQFVMLVLSCSDLFSNGKMLISTKNGRYFFLENIGCGNRRCSKTLNTTQKGVK